MPLRNRNRIFITIVVHAALFLAVVIPPAYAGNSDDAKVAANPVSDSDKKVERATKEIEYLEKHKDSLHTVPKLQEKFDYIRGLLLSIKPNDPQYKTTSALIDRYIELQSADKKESKVRRERQEAKEAKKRGVSIGMSKTEVLRSNWGKPLRKNITATAFGTSEQWVYANDNYLYFDGDTLTSIQTHH